MKGAMIDPDKHNNCYQTIGYMKESHHENDNLDYVEVGRNV